MEVGVRFRAFINLTIGRARATMLAARQAKRDGGTARGQLSRSIPAPPDEFTPILPSSAGAPSAVVPGLPPAAAAPMPDCALRLAWIWLVTPPGTSSLPATMPAPLCGAPGGFTMLSGEACAKLLLIPLVAWWPLEPPVRLPAPLPLRAP